MKFLLIAVGRDKKDVLCQAAAEYLDRLRFTFPAQLVEVREEPARANSPPDWVKQREAERIREQLEPGDYLITLDERGQSFRSVELAEKIGRLRDRGVGRVALVVGGPLGLDPELLRSAQERWALSPLTLPHRMARLLLAEQLYRAATILRGEPYHK